MEPPAGARPATIKDAISRAVSRDARRRPARTTCAASTTATARSTASRADSTTETYAALRLDIENWRWSGVPFFIRTGKRLPVTQTELRLVFHHPPRLGFHLHGRPRPEPTSSWSSSTRPTGDPADRRRAAAATRHEPEQISLDMEFAEQGGEGATPYEVLLHAAMHRRQRPASPARTASRRRGASCSRCSTPRRRSSPTSRAPGGRRGRPAGRRPRRLARAVDDVMSGTAASRRVWHRDDGADDVVERLRSACHGALRRHHHRHRRRRRHARAPPGAVGQAHPAARARRLAAARAAELVGRTTCSSTTATSRRTPGTTRDGKPFQPQVHYFVGGATKLYGAALYRLRAEDFGELRHHDGISPAWPISYDEMEPYYTQAEQLYQVHGARGEDPTEPPASAPYPFPAVSHEPRIQQLVRRPRGAPGYHPFHAPCGVMLNEAQHALQRAASAARPATASRASCTPSPTPRCSACARRSSTPTSRCSPTREAVRLETERGRHRA